MDPRQARTVEVGIKTEGSSNGLGGIAPGISVGMGSGGFGGGGLGGGGISLGTGGGRNNPNDRAVNLRLQVRLAKDTFSEDLR